MIIRMKAMRAVYVRNIIFGTSIASSLLTLFVVGKFVHVQ